MPSKKGKTLAEAFEECQRGLHNHTKLTAALRITYDELEDKAAFHQAFLDLFKHALVVFKREPAVERTLDFAAKFAASFAVSESSGAEEEEEEEEEEPAQLPANNFMVFLFAFLLKHHSARDRAVRFRVCQMINKLLQSLGEEAQIDEDLYQGIYDAMLVRLQDKLPAVRTQAVTALARLQDPSDADCPVIDAYMHLIEHDVNYEVRRTVLSNITMSAKTLPKILARTRDVKDSVRKTAFQVLAEKVHIKALTISQRVQLLQDGLTDRTDAVREACEGRLLQAWLRLLDGDALRLLACLDVENASKTATLALKVVLAKARPQELLANFDLLDDSLVIPEERLTCESAVYWQCLCSFMKTQGPEGELLLEKLLPSVTQFANYVRRFLCQLDSQALNETQVEESLKREFVAQQLLQLCGVLDLSDEVGRKHLDTMVRDMLIAPHVPSSLVPCLVTLFVGLHPGNEEQISLMAEIIADVREPIAAMDASLSVEEKRKKELKLAGVRVELNQARDALEDCIHKEDFSRAAELKTWVTELEASKQSLLEESSMSILVAGSEKSDPVTLVKCLTIASEVLQRLTVKGLGPTLLTLADTLVLPGIQNTDPSVRNVAVRCLGLASHLSRDFAHRHLLLLMQISQVDQETIQVTALQSILDLLHTFGPEAFTMPTTVSESPAADDDQSEGEEKEAASGQPDKSAASSVLAILTGLLDSESTEVRTVVAEGMAKLLLSGRLASAKLLTRLLLLWYNPTTEEDLHLRHCLGTFFPVFAFATRANQDCVEEAFLPTLETLFNAPTTSPLAQVNETNVAELLVHLTDQRNLRQETALQESSVHDNLSLKLCNRILADPEAPGVRVLCKILNLLHLTTTNTAALKDLDMLAQQMVQGVEERMARKHLERFQQGLQESLRAAEMAGQTPHRQAGPADQDCPDNEKEEEVEDKDGCPATGQELGQETSPTGVSTARNGDYESETSRVEVTGQRLRPRQLTATQDEDTENSVFESPAEQPSKVKQAQRSSKRTKVKMAELLTDSESDNETSRSGKQRGISVLAPIDTNEAV